MRALLVLLLPGLLALSARSEPVVLPQEGAQLNTTHVPFRFAPVESALGYQLQVVVDDGSPDPFAAALPVLELELGAAEPRTLVTQGLDFGTSYAWRARGLDPAPLPWAATRRFSTLPLPADMPAFVATLGPAPGPPQPGVTLFDAGPGFVAVDLGGTPVWFLEKPAASDIRLLPNGHLLFNAARLAYETALDGRPLWVSPDDPALRVHHEVFPLPNGRFLMLVWEFQTVLRDGIPQRWRGDRIVEYDPKAAAVVWSWSSFEHFSTLDFDADEMSQPVADGSFDWTHSNAVLYDPATDSIYLSVRSLSRITRIDRATGEIVFNLGMDMPSGDADFGNDLFSFQHAPELQPNGNLLVYDNGGRRQAPASPLFTRVVELAFAGGEPPSSASVVWEWTLPEYSRNTGDADRQPNGNVLTVAGPANKIYEVDPSGAIVWTLEAFGEAFPMYRAERVASLVVDTPGDADGDWDVDASDAEALQGCFGAPEATLAFPCTLSDLDADADVDCDDWTLFRSGWTDPGEAAPFAACDPPACDNGLDDDADGALDYPADLGCRNRLPESTESPACGNGQDDDADGLADAADPECAASPPWWNDEAKARSAPGPHGEGCGLGVELGLALPLLGWLRRQRCSPLGAVSPGRAR